MGVSGSGKTTVGRELARLTGWPFLEGDDLHPAANRAKMASGVPLTDADRWPWLAAIAEWIGRQRAAAKPGIVACSSLKRAYRDRLRAADPGLCLVYLRVDRDVLTARLAAREGHFYPPALLDSQLADLEEPGLDERPVIVPVTASPADLADLILRSLPDGHDPQ
jgi:gluconokinase